MLMKQELLNDLKNYYQHISLMPNCLSISFLRSAYNIETDLALINARQNYRSVYFDYQSAKNSNSPSECRGYIKKAINKLK